MFIFLFVHFVTGSLDVLRPDEQEPIPPIIEEEEPEEDPIVIIEDPIVEEEEPVEEEESIIIIEEPTTPPIEEDPVVENPPTPPIEEPIEEEEETPIIIIEEPEPVYFENTDTSKLYKIAVASTDLTYEVLSSEDTYLEALGSLQQAESDDLVIVLEDQIIYAKYGLVNLKTKSITENTYIYANGIQNYVNGHYGTDAVFIDKIGTDIALKISNLVGRTAFIDVQIIPLNYVKSPSYFYVNTSGNLVHALSSNLTLEKSYQYTGAIDQAPSYLNQGIKYYSYDGIYFYEALKDLILDTRENNTSRAINHNAPHYSYYQYLPFWTETKYTVEEINSYIEYELARRNILETSVLYNTGENFINVQTIDGINAAMELAFAIHESSFGTSTIAKEKYNLFGINAVDANPYGQANTFYSIEDGIRYHVEYLIIDKYLNVDSHLYYGNALGNKGLGFNVSYASDPYWGEKIAAFYYSLDRYLGSKDYGQYQLGMTITPSEVYLTPDDTTLLHTETARQDQTRLGLPLIILSEVGNYYEVVIGENEVGYILKENVRLV